MAPVLRTCKAASRSSGVPPDPGRGRLAETVNRSGTAAAAALVRATARRRRVRGILAQLDADQRAAAEIGRRPAADRRRPGLGQDPHADPSHRPSGRRARRRRRKNASPSRSRAAPPPRCASGSRACFRRDAERPRGPYLPFARPRDPARARPARPASQPGLPRRRRGRAHRAARRDAGRHRAQGRAAAARDLQGEAHARRSERRHRGGDVRLRAALARAQLDRFRRSASACAVRPWRQMPSLAAHYRDRFRFISVDEFQDVDEQQYRLLDAAGAAPAATSASSAIPNQAIYGFRGADASCFERFRRDYPRRGDVQLTRNYRSSGTIVAASSQVIGARRADRGDRARACTSASPSTRRRASGPRPSSSSDDRAG